MGFASKPAPAPPLPGGGTHRSPTTLGSALYHNGGLTLQWLLQPWDGFRRPLYTRSYLYALFASQVCGLPPLVLACSVSFPCF